ncbi:MAG: hypothetical protein OXC13_13625 [Caldilineaceae bacterium]|nr:hypothetical protein [Caldilineaceae bacterium]
MPAELLGRSHLRVYHLLYDYTVTAIQYNPAIHAFYIGLCWWGKPGNVALVAAMPQLFLSLNAAIPISLGNRILCQQPTRLDFQRSC